MKRISLVPAVCFSAIFGAMACGGAEGLGPTEEESVANTSAGLNILTRGYNNGRTGANLSETVLTPSTVSSSSFGRRFQIALDDKAYAGLLFVEGLAIGGGTHNVVYAATVNNSVYAFDADTGTQYWQKNFNPSGASPIGTVNNTQVGMMPPGTAWCRPYTDFVGKIGIVGTPVIDSASGTIYFVTRTVTGPIVAADGSSTSTTNNAQNFVQQLNALDIKTGTPRAGSPQTIQKTVPGNGTGTSGGNIAFNPRVQNQRAALAMIGNTIYVAWSGHCDVGFYHGWVMGFAKNTDGSLTGASPSAFVTTPNGEMGGIWQSGGGPLIDSASNLYYATANGWGNTGHSTSGFSNGMVKLSPGLASSNSYLDSDWQTLNANDTDLGSGGPSFVPGTNDSLIFTGGKTGIGYLLRSSDLSQVQKFQTIVKHSSKPAGATLHVHSSSAYLQTSAGLNMYVWGENDVMRVFRFNTSNQTFNTTPVMLGNVTSPYGNGVLGMPGGFMTVSANGSTSGTGIVWATIPQGDANHATVTGALRAFNAETLASVFDSTANSANAVGSYAKYNPPLVANGRVYVPSFSDTATSNKISVYGLSAPPPPPPPQGPFGGTAPTVPAKVQAENYDVGGEGVAFHDTDATNQGGQNNRNPVEGVDMEVCTDTASPAGGFNIGYIAQNEWLEYTVNSATASTYTLTARVAALDPGAVIGVQVNGASAGTITVPDTNGWQTWQTTTGISVNLNAGNNNVVRLTSNTATSFNLNWFELANGSPPPPPPPGTTYNAFADVYAKDASPTTNCNTATACGSTSTHQLEIKAGAAGFNRETFIRFEGVTGTTASNAMLRLCTFDPGTTGEYQSPTVSRSVIVEGLATADTWGETTLNWNNRPIDTGLNPVTLTVTGGGNCLNFNVTAFVNAQLAGGDGKITFRVSGNTTEALRTIFSGRSATSNVPQLTVTN